MASVGSGVLVRDMIARMPSFFAAWSSVSVSGLPQPAITGCSNQLKLRGNISVGTYSGISNYRI